MLPNVLKHTRKYPKAHGWFPRVPEGTFQDQNSKQMLKYVKNKIHESIRRYPKAYEGIRRYPKAYEDTRRLPKVLKHTRKYPKVPEGTRRYPKVPEGTQRYPKVPESIFQDQNSKQMLKNVKNNNIFKMVYQRTDKETFKLQEIKIIMQMQ